MILTTHQQQRLQASRRRRELASSEPSEQDKLIAVLVAALEDAKFSIEAALKEVK